MKLKDTLRIIFISFAFVFAYLYFFGIFSHPTVQIEKPVISNTQYNEIQKTVSADFSKKVNCLAKNVYYEARGESYEGKLAVTQVVLNRVNSDLFPNSVCGVVYQKTNTVCQFSWVCENHNKPMNPFEWQESVEIAKKALTSRVVYAKLASDGALFYHANYVSPGWHMKVVDIIGKHIFYSPGKT